MKALSEIRARLEAATPGPWSVGYSDGSGRFEREPFGESNFCIVESQYDSSVLHASLIQAETGEADATFIAHAPTDIARLLQALELREEQIKTWVEAYYNVAGPGKGIAWVEQYTREAMVRENAELEKILKGEGRG